MTTINKQRVLDEFFELVQIRCSTHDEREIGDLLTKRLKELGALCVKEDHAGDALGGNCGNLDLYSPCEFPVLHRNRRNDVRADG